MMPALLIRTSTSSTPARELLDCGEVLQVEGSHFDASRIVAAASSPFAVLRQARMTWAPTRASSRAVTRPSPLLAPVTITVRPANGGGSAAVQDMRLTLRGGGPTSRRR